MMTIPLHTRRIRVSNWMSGTPSNHQCPWSHCSVVPIPTSPNPPLLHQFPNPLAHSLPCLGGSPALAPSSMLCHVPSKCHPGTTASVRLSSDLPRTLGV